MKFSEIRAQYPASFLLLIDYVDVALPSGEHEVTAAKSVEAFNTGEEMIEAYKRYSHTGKRVMFCPPEHRDRLIFQRRPSMRV